MLLKDYPKVFEIRVGVKVVLKPMTLEDAKPLSDFFKSLPEEDRLFLKDDVTKKEVIDSWVKNLNYDRVLPMLAWIGDEVAGDATLHRNEHGWMKHIGEIRIVTDSRYRKTGLSLLLAREIFFLAVQSRLEKIVAEMTLDQKSAIRIFEKLGFKQEAVFKNHVLDLKGRKRDLLVMSKDLAELWQEIQESEFFSFPTYPMEG